jgi:hypothetical protein
MENKATKTRQKSCEQCVSSKRQCDRGNPKCSRCTSKGLRCLYKSAPHHRKAQSANTQELAPVNLPNQQSIGTIQAVAPTLDGMFIEQSALQLVSMPLPDIGIINSSNNFMVDDSFFTAFDNYSISNRPFPCEIGVMDHSRIRFLVRQLKTYPALLVHNGRAPFIHPQANNPLIPQPLQDAVSASALYLCKNEQNEAMVWEIVSAKVAQLMEP